MSQHTPGPWKINPSDSEDCIYIESGSDGIATVFGGNCAFDLANARLIAAAPELLEACRAADAAITYDTAEAAEDGKWDLPMAVAIRLRSAILKAEAQS